MAPTTSNITATGLYRMGSTVVCSERGPVTIPYKTCDYYVVRDGKVVEYVGKCNGK